MTYNLHNGFDTAGWLGLEALARTIEQQDPDVVALQEVARGWVIDGSTDMVGWLSQRLQMEYVFAPTAGPLWGNAVLSRLPIKESQTHPLPTQDLLLRRGYVRVVVDLGGGRTLDVIATHYHHLEDGSAVRVQESQAILDAWSGAPRTVFMGDLNAEPGSPEIEMLREAGLVEAVAQAGLSPGYTYDSVAPVPAHRLHLGQSGPRRSGRRIRLGERRDRRTRRRDHARHCVRPPRRGGDDRILAVSPRERGSARLPPEPALEHVERRVQEPHGLAQLVDLGSRTADLHADDASRRW